MEGGSLFNSGFLGASFLWWVGQIADDSVWRDNILPGKYADKNSIPGWGRRYKVRIIGLHDQGQETIPDDQLPWAQIMYPVTAGGGQTAAKGTANLRQGNMVFGFFLDGQDQQVPVIMGVLGNNSQTVLKQKTDAGVTNSSPGTMAFSGHSDGAVPKKVNAKEVSPDHDRGVKQPARKPEDSSKESGPGSLPAPGATNENVDGIHQITAADTKRQAKCDEKIVLLKSDPAEKVASAIKAIQTVIDNLITKIDSYLQAFQSYVDAVTNVISDIRAVIRNFACEIAKYMKIIFDKIMEYVMKVMNKALTKVVAALPSSLRYQFSDMKEIITSLIRCLYSKLTENLCDKVAEVLNNLISIDDLERQAKEKQDSGSITNPRVPMCVAEEITAQVLAGSRGEIDSANNNVVNNLDAYLEDISEMLAGLTGSFPDVNNLIPDIGGSITSALSFTNIKLNVFGCELEPNVSLSDFYTFCQGGDTQTDSQTPSSKSLDEKTKNSDGVMGQKVTPFVPPNNGEDDVPLGTQ